MTTTVTEAWVDVRPMCDIHRYMFLAKQPNVPAFFDGKTTHGEWAFMCVECFTHFGLGLGLGVGQRLLVHGETQD